MTYDDISSTSQQNHDTLSLPSSCAFDDFQVKDSSSSQCCRGYQNQSSYNSGNSAILNGNSSCYSGACLATYDGSSSSSKANHNVSSSSLIPSCGFDESQVKNISDSQSCGGHLNQSAYNCGNSASLSGNSSSYSGAYLMTYDGSSSSSQQNHDISSLPLVPPCVFDEAQCKANFNNIPPNPGVHTPEIAPSIDDLYSAYTFSNNSADLDFTLLSSDSNAHSSRFNHNDGPSLSTSPLSPLMTPHPVNFNEMISTPNKEHHFPQPSVFVPSAVPKVGQEEGPPTKKSREGWEECWTFDPENP
ncbi:unnamed protein product [Bemisia tabaci]|uniref:Uncharacterized protein n=1 Tax=Bemisia tabaci TaxID=7038 RepID=A0A9P0A1E8_BEMTA|nr:unnamed protein product [Bemisia tabaci]